ncbi:MAG: heme-binding protein, partial [Bacteroidota bacterium]|nr:heme-binding protein [Bacteroidota bacterium]
MKALYICAALLAIFLIVQTVIAASSRKTEQQAYRVVKKEKDFEIRFYPEATMASLSLAASNYQGVASYGFRKLANYIFGGNEASKSISMTAPVRMQLSDKGSTMSFVMPKKYDASSLPTPNDTSIHIHTDAAQYVAVINFGGYASDEKIKSNLAILEKRLKDNNINSIGPYQFLAYNPPYQI